MTCVIVAVAADRNRVPISEFQAKEIDFQSPVPFDVPSNVAEALHFKGFKGHKGKKGQKPIHHPAAYPELHTDGYVGHHPVPYSHSHHAKIYGSYEGHSGN